MDKSDVIAEIQSLIGYTIIGKDDLTIPELSLALRMGRHATIDRMDGLVTQGLYGKGKKFDPISKREKMVYWKLGEEQIDIDE